MKMILAPLDFSDATPGVVNEAANLARAIDGHVVLLHVVWVPPTVPRYATEMASLQARSAIEAAAKQQLAKIKEDLCPRGIAAHMLCLTGEPSTHIVEQAEKLGVDYIVMGSHGHSVFHDFVLGSTTNSVIRRSKRVVVIVPAPKETARPPRSGILRQSSARGGTARQPISS